MTIGCAVLAILLQLPGSSIDVHSFIGRWKLNLAESPTQTVSVSIVRLDANTFRIAGCCLQTGQFVLNGDSIGVAGGASANLRMVSIREWRMEYRRNGRIFHVDDLRLSPSGNQLTLDASADRPGQQPARHRFEFSRPQISTDLAGTWTLERVEQPDEIYDLSHAPDGKVTLVMPQLRSSFALDGRDYPVNGANVPVGLTYSGRAVGERAFELVQKQNGTPVVTMSFDLSDGTDRLTIRTNSLTQGAEPLTQVFDRIR